MPPFYVPTFSQLEIIVGATKVGISRFVITWVLVAIFNSAQQLIKLATQPLKTAFVFHPIIQAQLTTAQHINCPQFL